MSLTDDQQWDLIQRLTAAETALTNARTANAKLTAERDEARADAESLRRQLATRTEALQTANGTAAGLRARAEKAEAALEGKTLVVRAMGWELHDIIAGVGLDDEAAEWNGMRGSISGPVLDAVHRADVAHVAAAEAALAESEAMRAELASAGMETLNRATTAERALADMTAQRDARPDISREDAAIVWRRIPSGARTVSDVEALARAADALRAHAEKACCATCNGTGGEPPRRACHACAGTGRSTGAREEG